MTLEPLAIAGGITGAIEVAAGIVAILNARDKLYSWLKLFGIGALLLGVGQIVCKLIGHGILGTPITFAIGIPFKTLGLSILIYSILKAIDFPYMKLAVALIAFSAIYFMIGSIYSLGVTARYHNAVLFGIPHLLFLTVLPWLTASALFYIYKTMKDRGALTFGIGLLLYGLATIVIMYLIFKGASMFEAMTLGLGLRGLGVAVMLLGFFIAEME
ncbi:hypothetical protein IPA_03050 [Ignicoccus pacificus DSM 13166]|uniref:Uncharacterized protein n=1 Tax=Ignicoccus pacificus DSM 13166 TaxID=940294 RepID=A0A977KAU7_9CREN|nr:hypothetical protein IPA_03050 [Ignicoccus pacificus DSM 13166]